MATLADLTPAELEAVERATAREEAQHYEVLGRRMSADEIDNSIGRALESIEQQRRSRAAAEVASAQRRADAEQVRDGFARVVRALHRLAEKLRADEEIARVFGENVLVADCGPTAATLADIARSGGAPSWYAEGAPDPLTLNHPVTLTLYPLDVPAPGAASVRAAWEIRLPEPRMVALLDVQGYSRIGTMPARQDGALTVALARCGLRPFVAGAAVHRRVIHENRTDGYGVQTVTFKGALVVRDTGAVAL